jgi:hypothetical protein
MLWRARYNGFVPLDKAFLDWKSAHDRLQTLERLLGDAETGHAVPGWPRPIELRDEVRKQREVSEKLLQTAMKMLSERYPGSGRTGGGPGFRKG